MISPSRRGWFLVSLAVFAAASGFLAARVWAGGIPSQNILTYSGTLSDPGGNLLTGDHFVEIKLWPDASSTSDPLCTTNSQRTPVNGGHFSMPLPAACRDSVADHPDVFVEVLIDGATVGRSKIGAVPYAVEADHATKADSAQQAVGELKTLLDNANARLSALESATAPAAVVDAFNTAVAAGATVHLDKVTPAADSTLRWFLQHAAAAAGCAAASPGGDSVSEHNVITKPSGVTCRMACSTNAPTKPNCRTSIAIGRILPTPATSYSDIVATDYNYSCDDNQAAYDELKNQDLTSVYTAYCCCYM